MAGWTDYWDDWSFLGGAPDQALFVACLAALNERRTGIGYGTVSYNTFNFHTRAARWEWLLDELADVINYNRYVDHTQNNGNFEGMGGVPLWSTASIATAAGYPSWESVTEFETTAHIPAFVYDVLNLMRWIEAKVYNLPGYKYEKRYIGLGWDIQWEDVEAGFNATSWGAPSWTTMVNPFHGAYWQMYDTSQYYNLQFFRQKGHVLPGSLAPPSNISYKLDLYLLAVKYEVTAGLGTFQCNDYPALGENELKRVHEGTVIDSGSYGQDIYINFSFDNEALDEPPREVTWPDYGATGYVLRATEQKRREVWKYEFDYAAPEAN